MVKSYGTSSAEVIKTAKGEMYHIGVGPKDVAPYIIMVGDPARVPKVTKYFQKKGKTKVNRDYTVVTGVYKGIPMTVMATGMGPDNTEMAVVELSQIVKDPTFIRIGTSGALQDNIRNGDLMISTGALRLENTSTYFVHEGYPAVAHYKVVTALVAAADELGVTHHEGITATAPGFYGAQGRKTPVFKPRFPDITNELNRMNVKNLEMESSTLFSLCSMAEYRAGTVCEIIAERIGNKFIDPKAKIKGEIEAIKVGLRAMQMLAENDRKNGD